MNRYLEMKSKHSAAFNSFPMFFAFNQQQFDEGMRKLGLKETDTDKICSISGTGAYIRISDRIDFIELNQKIKQDKDAAIAADETGEGFIYDMFLYELKNHEYGYTWDDTNTLEALGYTEDDINADPRLKAGLKAAKKKIMEEDYD